MTPAELKAITDRLTSIESTQSAILRMLRAMGGGVDIADDRELDGKYGDPDVKFDLRSEEWQGASMIGNRFSECPVEWLDALAASKESYAEYLRGPKRGAPEDIKKAGYAEKDAARARGWAKRLRSGWRPAGTARPQGAPPRAATAPTAAAYGQAPPRGFGADATGQGQQAAYGGGAGYGGGGASDFGTPGADDDVPFVSCAFDPHRWP
jgi:hypothetical protein